MTAHLIGAPTAGGVVQGHKSKHLVAETGCWMHVSGHNADDVPMRITIKPKKNRKGKGRRMISKIRLAISMIEKSLVEFLADKNSENRLLYELAATAKGTLCHNLFQRDASSGLLLREHDGVKKWLRLFDLPRCDRGNYHGFFLLQTKLKHAQGSDCKIEVFERSEKVPLASPYVSICGSKQNEVKSATAMVAETMRRHQRLCPCRPRW